MISYHHFRQIKKCAAKEERQNNPDNAQFVLMIDRNVKHYALFVLTTKTGGGRTLVKIIH
jgi:hypothetical protein